MGEISLAQGGYGFFISDNKEYKDVFISQNNLNLANDKDRVKICLLYTSKLPLKKLCTLQNLEKV